MSFRPIEDGDLRWLWAAYQMGVWKEVLSEGIAQHEFREVVADLLGSVHHEWIIEVPTDKGLRPIGLITAVNRFGGHGIEPHVDWFPWASPRRKLETVAQFVLKVGRDVKIHLYVGDEDAAFWERVWKYKVIKKGCKITDCLGAGNHVMYYNTPGPFKCLV